MRNLKLVLPAIMLAITAGTANAAAATKSNAADLIPGLGEGGRVGAKNISLSPKFKAYKFSKDGLDYVQVNSLMDEDCDRKLTTMAVVNDDKQQPMGMVTAAATRPCCSQPSTTQ
ncbi:hypothetical protein NB697_001561 [Xanthomonas sacchari]|uniref:hypothetical protein n=1 Tax=Xanthomonas sacchari TaxID=56458 RepID=UPI00225285CB|nr:hypothetical protein [Xanthomonas sacchari]MCW0378715.1 hypothetical protein [Xanthomonas sacchari]